MIIRKKDSFVAGMVLLLCSNSSTKLEAQENRKWLESFPTVELFVKETNPNQTVWNSPCPPPPTDKPNTDSCLPGVSGVPIITPETPINPCPVGSCGPGVGLEGAQQILPSGDLMQFDK